MNIDEKIWKYLKNFNLRDYAISGIMGNLYAESGLNPKNLQNSYNTKLELSDEEYTNLVDNGKYTNFIYDSAGYGLAQWTFWSLKRDLLNYCKNKNKSIGDLETQLDFLMQQLSNNYTHIMEVFETANSVEETTKIFLLEYERPADQGISAQQTRINYAKNYYDKFANINLEGSENMGNSPLVSYTKISPNRSTRTHEIDTVTIHCVVGQASVEGLGATFANASYRASSNYGVGTDGRIGMYVEEKDRSWCSSNSTNDNRAITIEVASDTYYPYAVNDAAYEGLIKLLVDICTRHPKIGRLRWKGDKNLIGQIEKQNMTVHRWFANKSCPGEYLYSRHAQIAAEVNRRLDAGITYDGDEDDMTLERFKELMTEYRKDLQDNDCGSWSKEARDWAIGVGLINGTGRLDNGEQNYAWADMLTREQMAMLLFRFYNLIMSEK